MPRTPSVLLLLVALGGIACLSDAPRADDGGATDAGVAADGTVADGTTRDSAQCVSVGGPCTRSEECCGHGVLSIGCLGEECGQLVDYGP